ncbi:GMC family oxidoreductase [Castellaniella sp.]|uniref:GMC family oxidoreductase n=1 Tax=Castellaniella sp. TaxID=1955812 RepID=UPI002AFECA1C|nr:GMC family oxidoreductase [Castellaniella sp.]
MADYDCEVCVVGTGAGGGILAYTLAQAGVNVISLEQGAALPDDQFTRITPPDGGDALGIGPNTVWPSDPHDGLFIHPLFADGQHGSTARQSGQFQHFQILALNGLQNLWNGVSVRFSPQDLAPWPIDYSVLEPHYGAVEELITVCGTCENIPELPDGCFIPPKPLRPADQMIVDAVRSLGEPHSHAIPNRKAINTIKGTPHSCISSGICTSGCPVGAVYKFSVRLLPQIAQRPNYQLRTQAKVLRLVADADGKHVSAVEYLDTETGQRHRVRARYVVLAAGAIESPRILFNSATPDHPQGMANQEDQLGRRLQDNPKVVLSTSLYKLWGKRRDYDIGYGDHLILMSRGLLPDGSEFPFIGHAIHGLPTTPHYLTFMRHLGAGLKDNRARAMFHSYMTLGLFCAGEPLADNRVMPGDTQDMWGVPQLAINFSIPPQAHRQMDAMMAWGHKVLRRSSATLLHTTRDNSGTGIHYAGTTAMSDTARDGVVDADLKAHGLDNLYVCDGGVVPILPDKHLTLTIMALAHRLGGHLAQRLQAT